VMRLPPPGKGNLGIQINAKRKKPKKNLELLTQLNQMRGNINLSGKLNNENFDSWFSASYEGNISGIYLKSFDLNPRNNKYTGIFETKFRDSKLTFAGIHKNTGLIVKSNKLSPELSSLQTGVSIEYENI